MVIKKLITFMLAVIIFSMLMIPAFASGGIDLQGKSESADVVASYVERTTDIVYSVDITWESMTFVYNSAYAGEWDATTRRYTGARPAEWTTSNNKITIANNSNAGVTVDLGFEVSVEYEGIIGHFKNAEIDGSNISGLTLDSAVGKTIEETTKEAWLVLSGTLSSETQTQTKIGTVTVTLN